MKQQDIKNLGAIPFAQEKVAHMEPYLTTLADRGFLERNEAPELLAVPDTHTMIAIDLNIFAFERHCQFVYTNITRRACRSSKTGKLLPALEIRGDTWWEDGLQAFMVNNVRLISDDGKEVFVFYDAMNNKNLPQWLGRLVPGFASTKLILARMCDFIVEWAR